MAEVNIDGRMKVKTLKENFKKEFGSNIRIYKGQKFAEDDATLTSIREEGKKGGSINLHGNTKVDNVEKLFKEHYGIRVQIEDKSGKLADNDITIAQAGK